MKKTTFFFLVISLSLISIIFLFAFIAPFVNPSLLWVFPLSALMFKYLFFVFIVFTLALYFVRKKVAIIFIIILIPSVYVMSLFYKVSFNNMNNNTNNIKLLTYNVHNLCNDNDKYDAPLIRNKILDFIKSTNSDFMFLQDFSFYNLKKDSALKHIHSVFKNKYFAFANYHRKNKYFDALAIISKYPIIKTKAIYEKDEQLFALVSDVKINKDTFRLYNLHINPFKISGIRKTKVNRIKLIFSKMHQAYSRRAIQVEYLKNDFLKSKYPVIVAGDLNDIALSYTYNQLIEGKNDAFMEKGNGFSNTYNGTYPSFRIDYILADKRFKITSYKCYDMKLSDHYPITCNILL